MLPLDRNLLRHRKTTQQTIQIFLACGARGEKKRHEIFQMSILEPKLTIMDETDSGLDIDALKIVSHGVNTLRNKDNAVVIVTHYQRLLNYIVPDHVHVLLKGRIVRSGGKELALELENKGYDWIRKEVTNETANT